MSNRKRFAHMSSFRKLLASIAVLVIAGTFVALAVIIRAEELEDGVEVEKNSELTYYLHVKYDGVDVSGVQSSDTTMAEVLSDRIKVTDVLPKGLTFKGFVTSPNGTFGAVSRADSNVACAGHVYDDTKEESLTEGTWDNEHKNFYYHGLHYNEDTRLVSFYVERLKAGCVLDIGIITQTPATVDDPETEAVEIRRDFYNTAIAKEGDITARSNTVHVWMGSLIANEHTVTYAYTGTVPTGAPAVPAAANYSADASVVVEEEPHLDGYVFSGWTSTDVTPANGVFTMPNNDVAFVGNWVEETTPPTDYQVIYQVYGATQADEAPEWALPPKTRRYYPETEVATDSTEEGMFDGYHFSGWYWTDPVSGEEVKVGTGFVMPENDVVIRGYYDRVSYTVTYQFEGAIIPPNADELLPETQSYYPDDLVTTAPYPTAQGYRFLGWYKGETFRMPAENVIIYGEWGIEHGQFAPTIAKEVIEEPGTKYIFGDTVQFKITLCNTAEYPIHDVVLQEQLEGAAFVNGATSNLENVELETTLPADSILRINNIPANSCAITYASYVVRTGEEETITNTVEMIGALADDYNNLDTSQDYTASDTFDVDAYSEPDPVTGVDIKNTFVFIGLVILTIIGGSIVILIRKRA